ncbi:hypothetical protein DL93DRAFT_2052502 [Clavulina sp. PMI_390]|nr:hypothetical protein DL93DRAFT_2052502 [Clavulina sp. PMI_390]
MSTEQRPALRFLIIGTSGAGKTTLATQLENAFQLPKLSLDTVFWMPEWKQRPAEDMQARVGEFVATHPSWVIDGNYFRKIGTLALDKSTHIIWLDPPFWKFYPILVYRTIRRYFKLEPTCADGCVEHLREFYAKDGLLRWIWDEHDKHLQKFDNVTKGDPRLIVFRGWDYRTGVQQWFKEVTALYGQKPPQ